MLALLSKVHSLSRLLLVSQTTTSRIFCVCVSFLLHAVLAEQLVLEVKRLQKELSLSKGKVQTVNEIIGKMPSEGVCVHGLYRC